MTEEDIASAELREALAKRRNKVIKSHFRRTELAHSAPAPHLSVVIAEHGQEPTAQALVAWSQRVRGERITDVAHEMGLSIEAAKALIKEAHEAIADDLKTNLNLNRQLDLDRVDGILKAFYPSATHGDLDAANVTLKALSHRAKLTGVEPLPDPGRSNPQNVLVWIQSQLPAINRIVDALPLELPPAAP